MTKIKTPIIAANWKMNQNSKETEEFFKKFSSFDIPDNCSIIVAPPYTSLVKAHGEIIKNKNVRFIFFPLRTLRAEPIPLHQLSRSGNGRPVEQDGFPSNKMADGTIHKGCAGYE